MAKKTKEEKIQSIKLVGKEINFDFHVTKQASKIIDKIDDFPVDHFKQWFKNKYSRVTGAHLMEYLARAGGIDEVK